MRQRRKTSSTLLNSRGELTSYRAFGEVSNVSADELHAGPRLVWNAVAVDVLVLGDGAAPDHVMARAAQEKAVIASDLVIDQRVTGKRDRRPLNVGRLPVDACGEGHRAVGRHLHGGNDRELHHEI